MSIAYVVMSTFISMIIVKLECHFFPQCHITQQARNYAPDSARGSYIHVLVETF